MKTMAWLDGRIIQASEARIPILDRGNRYGDGIYETMRVNSDHSRQNDDALGDEDVSQSVVRFAQHRARFVSGLAALDIASEAVVSFDAAVRALAGAATGPCRLRVQATHGVGEFVGPGEPLVSGTISPILPNRTPRRLVTGGLRRDTQNPLVQIKHMGIAPAMHARRAALARGADDALLMNEHGRVAEATTANVVAWSDGALHAPGPEEGALPGVTRAALLDGLPPEIPVRFILTVETLARAHAVWLTNATQGAVSVQACDAFVFSGACPDGLRDAVASL